MHTRPIGDTGLEASIIGIGTMRINGQENSSAVINRALDLGFNYLDCGAAYAYKDFNTNAEAWVGEAIKGRDRSKMIISAKAQPRPTGEAKTDCNLGISTRDQMWQCIENSLKRIGVSFLDFYQFWDMSNMEHFEGACVGPTAPLVALREAKEQGIIRHLGFTTHAPAKDIMEMLRRVPDFRFITVYYNFMRREIEEAIAFAKQNQVGVAVMGPLYGGILTGDSPALSRFRPGSQAMSLQEIAFRFLFANPGVTTCLAGMSDPAQADVNARIAETSVSLDPAQLEEFSAALGEFTKTETLCTGCQYCGKVCPQELPIWQLMGIYQLSEILKMSAGQTQLSQIKKSGKPDPSSCVECGQCEEACPQNLPIGERMKALAEILAKMPAPAEQKG